jgi:hypothetical protein
MSRYSLGTICPTVQQVKSLQEDTLHLKDIEDIANTNTHAYYGFDNTCGYFLQLYPQGVEDAYGEQKLIDIDSIFCGLTGAELAYFLELFHGNMSHITFAALDLPF